MTYDNNGNLTSDGVNSYIWDRANRLLSMGGVDYQYDGEGHRVQQTVSSVVTKYLLDIQPGLSVVLSETTNSDIIRNVFSPRGIHAQQDSSNNWQWIAQDGLGNVREVADNTVGLLESRNYGPYGDTFDGTITTNPAYEAPNFGFTGELVDGSGLLDLRTRRYHGKMGVFTSLDRFEGEIERPMSLNGYSWVEGNVANLTDPNGMSPLYKLLTGRNSGVLFGGQIAKILNSGTCLPPLFVSDNNAPSRCATPPQLFDSGFKVDLNKINSDLVEKYGVILSVQCNDDTSSGSVSWNDPSGNTRNNLERALSIIDSRLIARTGLDFKSVFGGVEFRLLDGNTLKGAAITKTPYRIQFDEEAIFGGKRSAGAFGPNSTGGNYGFVNTNDSGIQATVVHELGHILHLRTIGMSSTEHGSHGGGGLYNTATLFRLNQLAPALNVGGLREGVQADDTEAVLEDVVDHFLNWVYKSYLGDINPDDLRSPGTELTLADRLISQFWIGGKVRISDEVGYVWSKGIKEWATYSSRSAASGLQAIQDYQNLTVNI